MLCTSSTGDAIDEEVGHEWWYCQLASPTPAYYVCSFVTEEAHILCHHTVEKVGCILPLISSELVYNVYCM